MKKTFFKNSVESEEYWISVSDMMAGLMMVFLLIAIIYMIDVQDKTSSVEKIKRLICSELEQEFSEDKENWNMTICEDGLVVAFQNDAVFKKGSADLTPKFTKILDNFFPKFMGIILKNDYRINELRIEGHTSSEYTKQSINKSYLLNTKLSQNRSYKVMEYAFNISGNKEKNWMNGNLTAHGLSSSKLVFKDKESSIEDRKKSRRVEFRIQTNAEIDLVENLRLKIQEIVPNKFKDSSNNLNKEELQLLLSSDPNQPPLTQPEEFKPSNSPEEVESSISPEELESSISPEEVESSISPEEENFVNKKPRLTPSKPQFGNQ